MNIQKDFSLAEVFETGVTAGVGSYMNGAGTIAKGVADETLAEMAKKALKIGALQVGTQLTEMATGLRSKFDPNEIGVQVLASLAGSVIDQKVSGALEGTNEAVVQGIKRTVKAATNELIGSAVRKTPFSVKEAAANALGNFVADQVDVAISDSIKQATRSKSSLNKTAVPGPKQIPAKATFNNQEIDVSVSMGEDSSSSYELPTSYEYCPVNPNSIILSDPNTEAAGQSLGRAGFAADLGNNSSYNWANDIAAGASDWVRNTNPLSWLDGIGERIFDSAAQKFQASEWAPAPVKDWENIILPNSNSMYDKFPSLFSEKPNPTIWKYEKPLEPVYPELPFLKGLGLLKLITSFNKSIPYYSEGKPIVDDPQAWGNYRVNRELPRNPRTKEPTPDSNRPHTQIGQRKGSNGEIYTQAREWGYDADGSFVPKKDIDFTNHGRANHPNPHQHRWIPNPTGGTLKRGGTEPLNVEPLNVLAPELPKIQNINKRW